MSTHLPIPLSVPEAIRHRRTTKKFKSDPIQPPAVAHRGRQ
jgi:hypothetical protein